ncbi:MAG TPA: hypothetical protein VM115_05950 [Vicinamibacterales bacterium]|nr:hypothetical protein [Vicinamibacterales bacterium]
MTRHFSVPAIVLTLALAAAPIHAEVKKEERNQVSFAGVLGRVFNLFGGKAAKEGIVSTVAVSGDRKMTTSGENSGQIVDLKEEKIYDLDMRRKTYKVTTFEELRKQMREAEARARESASKEQGSEQPSKNDGKELEVDFDVKNTGQTKAINGFDTRQVIATITVREKGKKIEQSGGIIMTVDTWLSKSAPSLKEVADFERRYWEKLAGPMTAVDAQQMATVAAMFPGVKDAFARFSKEDLGGTAIQSTTTMVSVKSAEQMKQQASGGASASSSEKENPLTVGGALGGFMRRRQQQNQEKEAAANPNANPAHSTFMTINNEVLKIATNVTAADVAMPAGFKERN